MVARPEHYSIIKRPLLTEKTAGVMAIDVYTFEVDSKATKSDVREAVEAIWDVKVKKVRTINTKGEQRRNRWGKFRTAGMRKAFVTLKEGYAIEVA